MGINLLQSRLGFLLLRLILAWYYTQDYMQGMVADGAGCVCLLISFDRRCILVQIETILFCVFGK